MVLKDIAQPIEIIEGTEHSDLPVSWMSPEGKDLTAVAEYERQCLLKGQVPEKSKIEQLIGGETYHLRLTTLQSGLKYVTIRGEDGREVFGNEAYDGLKVRVRNDWLTPDAQNWIHRTALNNSREYKPTTSRFGIPELDVDNGFHLSGVLGFSKETESIVQKTFKIGEGPQVEDVDRDVNVFYRITPDKRFPRIQFKYEVSTALNPEYRSRLQKENNHDIKKFTIIEIIQRPTRREIERMTEMQSDDHMVGAGESSDDALPDLKNYEGYTSVKVQYQFKYPQNSAPQQSLIDFVEFIFRPDGSMKKLSMHRSGVFPAPLWRRFGLEELVPVGSSECEAFMSHTTQSHPELIELRLNERPSDWIKKIFNRVLLNQHISRDNMPEQIRNGKDFELYGLNTRKTLEKLMEFASKEYDADPLNALVFGAFDEKRRPV